MKKNLIKPKKVNRLPKKNYTLLRDNYKCYRNANWTWIEVFHVINRLKARQIKNIFYKVAKRYNIRISTLKNKYYFWCKTGEITDERGLANKMFSEEEERQLFEYIKEMFIDNHLFLDDECLGILAKKKWDLLHPDRKNDFLASNGWIYEFKIKWGLVSSRIKMTKKATKNHDDKVKIFHDQCKTIKETISKDLIFNTDETNWNINTGLVNILAIKGSDERKLKSFSKEKDNFTVVLTASAIGKFLKSIVIMKGKTDRSLNKINDINDEGIIKKYTYSGWVTVDIIKTILDEIYKISQNRPAALLLDEYSVHKLDEIKSHANKLNIQLIFIPPGKTSIYQPLDVGVNGPLKSAGKNIIKEIFLEDPFKLLTIKESLSAFIDAKNKMKDDTIKKAFLKACGI